MADRFADTKTGSPRTIAKLWLLVLLFVLAVIPSARGTGADAGVYIEGADKVEIAPDAGTNNPTATFDAGDIVYIRVTTPRPTAIGAGSYIRLEDYEGNVVDTGSWIQESAVSPYVYTAELNVPDPADKYLEVLGLVKDGGTKFMFQETIHVNGLDQHLQVFRDPGRTLEAHAFTPGATMYLSVYGNGDSYNRTKTGNGSQRLNNFSNSTVISWDAPPAVTQNGNVYEYDLTLPAVGLTDDWWYSLDLLLQNDSGADIVDQAKMVQVDETPPETYISDPTGGSALGGTRKAIVGSATNDITIYNIAVAITRDADGFYWDTAGSTWTAGAAWNDASITSGQGTPAASWMLTWDLPLVAGAGFTIQAKATDEAGIDDPTPALVAVTVENTGLTVGDFLINGHPAYTNSATVTLQNDASNAQDMRFAESTAALSSEAYVGYDTTYAYVLTGSDGTKTVFAQYRDAFLNETSDTIFDQIRLDMTAPAVATHMPGVDEDQVEGDTSVTVSFSENYALDSDSINATNLYLKDSFGVLVPAIVSYDSTGLAATLLPKRRLRSGEIYSAYVTDGVEDMAGNGLASVYSWSFMIHPAPPAGPFTEDSTDTVEIARDAAYATLISEYDPGDTIYIRATTKRVTSAQAGSRLALTDFVGNTLATANWVQTSATSPYVYETSMTIATSTVDYRQLLGDITDGSAGFDFEQTIEIVGVNHRFHSHKDPDHKREGYAFRPFRPGETIYVMITGTGEEYSALKTGTASQVLHDFAGNQAATWDAPADSSMTRDGDTYTFPLTLPSSGMKDGWWYNLAVHLENATNETIVEMSRFIVIDLIDPETWISDPTGGTVAGTQKLITGTAGDSAGVSQVSVGIERAADNYWWNGSTWVAGQQFIDADIVAGQDSTSATWQYSWTLPTSDDETFTIYAKAIDLADGEDPTPATVSVRVDNVAPAINSFAIGSDATYADSTTVTLDSSVTGATEMRFSESLGLLGSTLYELYASSDTIALSGGDGTKTIYAQYRDVLGNYTTAGSLGSFDTIILDTSSPVVASADPPDAATAVPTTKTITADFSEINELDASSIVNDGTEDGSSFYLKDGADWTAATVSYNAGLKQASLTPQAPLTGGVTYTAYLTPGITDAAGNSLDTTYTWSFAALESVPPDTIIADPLGGALNGSSKTITGSATDNLSVSTVTVSIARDLDGYSWNETTWTAGAVWNNAGITSGQDTTAASWQYVWPLPSDNGGGYTISARAADGAGNADPMPAIVAVTVDNAGPTINSFIIANDATYTNSSNVTLSPSADGASDMRFAETTAGLTGAIYEPYDTTTSFSLSVGDGTKTVYSQHKDSSGNETTPAITNSFDTVILDTSAPVAASVDPPDLGAGVPTTKTVTVDFAENFALDPSTIVNDGTQGGSTFYLTEGAGFTTASVSYNAGLKRATLTPAAALSVGTTYTVYLTTGIRDEAGNPLGAAFSWSFKTTGVGIHAPAAPTGVQATADDMVNVVTWVAVAPAGDAGDDFNPPGQGGYNVYRSTTDSGPWTQANSSTVTVPSFNDTIGGAVPKGIYFYMVRAVDAVGTESDNSSTDDNANVDMSKNTDTSQSVVLDSANDNILLSVPAQAVPTTITITTPPSYPGGVIPITLVYQFEPSGTTIDPSATVTLKTPGDPTGLAISVNRGSGWQVLDDGNYSYNVTSQTITYAGIDQFSHYTVTEATLTPPHGTYLPTTTFCEVCHNLHLEDTSGFQRERRLLRAEEDNTDTVYAGSWTTVAGEPRSSGGATVSSTTSDTARLFFKGTGIALRATETSASGRARVYIDGTAQGDIDLYRISDAYQVRSFQKNGLANDNHTMTVEVLGTKNASSTGFAVEADAFDVTRPKDMGLIADDEKTVCYICHDGTGSTYDIYAQFRESSPTPTSSHPVADGTVLCSDCHSPHSEGENWDATHTSHEAVRLLRSDFGTYLGFLVVESNPWLDTPQPASLGFGVPEQRKLSAPYESCGSCHGAGSTLPGGDILADYDSGGTKHDSTATVPAGAKADIACTSCHEWHVSDLPKLLESTISGNQVTGNDNSVCYACHAEAKISAYNDTTPTGDVHGANESTQTTMSPGLLSPYTYRYPQIGCGVCHDPHGAGSLLWVPETVNGTGTIRVDSTAAADWTQIESLCIACHTTTHNPSTECLSCHFHGANQDATTTTRF